MVHSKSFGWDPHVLYEKQQQQKIPNNKLSPFNVILFALIKCYYFFFGAYT